jgi:hypothetical protein
LQRNKAAAVARLGAVVHSVDRSRWPAPLGRVGVETGRPVEVFLQVDLGGPRGSWPPAAGPDPAEVPALADAVAADEASRSRAHGGRPARSAPGPAFARLAALAERVRADHPEALDLSAGHERRPRGGRRGR